MGFGDVLFGRKKLKGANLDKLFATHPPLEKRLARLAAIAREMGKPVE